MWVLPAHKDIQVILQAFKGLEWSLDSSHMAVHVCSTTRLHAGPPPPSAIVVVLLCAVFSLDQRD